MPRPKEVLPQERLEAKLLSRLRQDPGFGTVEQVVVRRLEAGKEANWNLAKISPPVVLGTRTKWETIKRIVSDLQHRYDIEEEANREDASAKDEVVHRAGA